MALETISELQRQIQALRAGNEVLRKQNIALAVENNNLLMALGQKTRPLTGHVGHQVEWELQQEANQ